MVQQAQSETQCLGFVLLLAMANGKANKEKKQKKDSKRNERATPAAGSTPGKPLGWFVLNFLLWPTFSRIGGAKWDAVATGVLSCVFRSTMYTHI